MVHGDSMIPTGDYTRPHSEDNQYRRGTSRIRYAHFRVDLFRPARDTPTPTCVTHTGGQSRADHALPRLRRPRPPVGPRPGGDSPGERVPPPRPARHPRTRLPAAPRALPVLRPRPDRRG